VVERQHEERTSRHCPTPDYVVLAAHGLLEPDLLLSAGAVSRVTRYNQKRPGRGHRRPASPRRTMRARARWPTGPGGWSSRSRPEPRPASAARDWRRCSVPAVGGAGWPAGGAPERGAWSAGAGQPVGGGRSSALHGAPERPCVIRLTRWQSLPDAQAVQWTQSQPHHRHAGRIAAPSLVSSCRLAERRCRDL
jgi:hypothetical protein